MVAGGGIIAVVGKSVWNRLDFLTDGDFVVRGIVAETGAGHSQHGSAHQGAELRGNAVDLQDVLDGGLHTVAMKQKQEKQLKAHVNKEEGQEGLPPIAVSPAFNSSPEVSMNFISIRTGMITVFITFSPWMITVSLLQ